MICPKCEDVVSVPSFMDESVHDVLCEWHERIDGTREYLYICPKCYKEGKWITMVTPEVWDAIERKKELEKRIYCRSCEYIGLIEEFPFNGHPRDEDRERICPACHSDNVINLACMKMCENCDEVPAQKGGDAWCRHCADQFNTEFDDHPWDDF
ncbi:MAG: hypothetical protein U1A25_01860 [Candidatus Sungbacteria bacterium]|nr:hypothetical protein [Candidatus Sungbacteria bacterium]